MMVMMRKLPRFLALAALLLSAACASTQTQSAAQSQDSSWIARAAIYEVFTRDFSPEGTFKGIQDNLDRIQKTGVNVIWLMPIHPIGKLNRKDPLGSPYSATDYRAVNPDFGNDQDFRNLVRAVHARGMKLIIDWVPNHTAWDHVWVKSHPERYTRVASGAMTPPMDPQGKPTDWTDVADLNYNDAGLRRAMIDDMKYWVQNFDIDGFRMDVAGWVPGDFWTQAINELHAIKPMLFLAEAGEPAHHDYGFHLTYGWDSYGRLKGVWKGEPAAAWVQRQVEDSRLPNRGMRLRFTTNHDETAWDQPPVKLFGGSAGARAAFVAMVLLPGTPLLYNGQEVESPQTLRLFYKDAVEWNQPNADATTAFYRRVIDLERTHPAFAGYDLEPVQTNAGSDVISYRRGNVVVLSNTRPREVTVTVSDRSIAGAKDLLSGVTQSGETIVLQPYGFSVLETR